MYTSDAPDLAKLLSLLPNLDTLEVLTRDYDCLQTRADNSFNSVKLPRIRMLVIDSHTHNLMKCCINVKRVVIHEREFDSTYLESIPFVADSLVYLALCLPASGHIRGAGVSYHYRRCVI